MMRNTMKMVATSIAAIQGCFINQNINTLWVMSKDNLL